MNPIKEIGECLIACYGQDYFFRPSFINMTRIGEPREIVQVFHDLHHDEITPLLRRAINAYGLVPTWLVEHIKTITSGRKAIMAAMTVMQSCSDEDLTQLIGELLPARTAGRAFKFRRGAMGEIELLVVAQSLMAHGIIGKANVRKLQRHESNETTSEFKAFEYISAARNHFGMSRVEAEQLTMTEFQLLIAAKYPEQKGFTREEYDAVADDYMARKARRLAKEQ